MRELSLNILDIAKNSCKAKATLIEIFVNINEIDDLLEIIIADNGCGMTEGILANIVDPFTTTRTTRKVGMGIPLFVEACESTGGKFEINSTVGVGTKVSGTFGLTHIDRMPLGEVADSVAILVMGDPQIDFNFTITKASEEFRFSTKEVKEMLGEDDLSEPAIITYLKDYMKENIEKITGGNL